jgi:F-type H+-transporting ATPase subunit c
MKFFKFFVFALLATPLSVLAAEGGYTDASNFAWASGLTIALAAIGGTFAQGKAASVALEGIARNPGAADKLFTPMIVSLALIESLVVFSFVIAFFLNGKF